MSSARPRSKALKASKPKFGGVAASTIALFAAAGLIAAAIVGYAGWKVWDATRPFGEQRAQQIDGIENYRAKDVGWLTNRHKDGDLNYKTSPPTGGDHNSAWQTCDGAIYSEPIADEHAVHSMEHGAVWVTYRPDLAADQVNKLQERVQGRNFTLMSPYPDLKAPIVLVAWGFMLEVDDADDKRIDKFIKEFREKSSVERGATCGNGVTATGTAPIDQSNAQVPTQ